jgi:predicted RNA-binding protein (virulence factor B family)
MLKIEHSCEIEDLIKEVINKTDKTYKEVERAMFRTFIYPESTKTYLTTQFGPIVEDKDYAWLNDVLTEIFAEAGIESVYVTNAI